MLGVLKRVRTFGRKIPFFCSCLILCILYSLPCTYKYVQLIKQVQVQERET